MLKRILLVVLGIAVLVAGGAAILLWGSQEDAVAERPDLPFAPLSDASLKDPDAPNHVFRVDLARVEAEFPISRAALATLTPAQLATLNQEELDQLYGRLTAGPIPDGPYAGDLFFPRGEDMAPRLERILGGLEGRIASEKLQLAEKAGRSLWKGKVFFRDQRLLRNQIEDFKPLEALIGDPGALETIDVPREGWLKYIRPTTSVWLLFPAKLYCGQSLLDGRRESIIIDYAYNDDLPGFQARPDALAGRDGLQVRDEIRMVRPGLYLGRAYLHKVFLLNFVLHDPATAEAGATDFAADGPVAEDCWPGEQARTAAR